MREKVHSTIKKVRGYGIRWSVRWGALVGYYLARSALPSPLGYDETDVFDETWDVLVLLDGCTVDLMRRVRSEYDFLSNVSSIRSVGSSSGEWMEKTFSRANAQETERTAYVTGNPHSDMLLSSTEFLLLDEVWKYGWDEELGTVPARPITDQAIEVMRADSPERLIVHYMQPHFPAVRRPDMGSPLNPEGAGNAWTGSVWDQLRRGELTRTAVEEAFIDNLRYVLDDVALLLQSVDADTVAITADHGNSFGDFGLYGHHGYVHLPSIREVPWCLTEASDSGDYTPEGRGGNAEYDIERQLSALGYRS